MESIQGTDADALTTTTRPSPEPVPKGPSGSRYSRSAPYAPSGRSESEVRDAHAEGLRKSAAIEEPWQRIARLPRLDRAHRGSHLVRQPSLRPLARIRRVRLSLRAKLQKLVLP